MLAPLNFPKEPYSTGRAGAFSITQNTVRPQIEHIAFDPVDSFTQIDYLCQLINEEYLPKSTAFIKAVDLGRDFPIDRITLVVVT